MELINSFKKYLIAIVPELVYKSVTQAEAEETAKSRLHGDQYIDARLRTGEFDSIRDGTISVEVLNRVGIYDPDIIDKINDDKYVIPERLRKSVLELHRNNLIENYVEENNYYRMLYGLPNVGDSGIYLDPTELNSYGYYGDTQYDYDNDNFDKLTPLHKLPSNVLLLMEAGGYLDELYTEYSENVDNDVEYIKHLASKKIDPFVSRMAGQYELLYVPTVDNARRFTKDFINYYEEARQYFLSQIYNFHYNTEYDFYEGYIGFFILVMAVQRTINSLFEVVVQRDFYDVETCRMFLDAYGVPFISTFTFNQQLALVKNLNILLMKKCTTTVLYDLLDILDYDRYSISKYLLVKQHKTEQAGMTSEPKPIFVYKTKLSEDGTPIYELDKSKMYDYYFISTDVDSIDTTLVEETEPTAYAYELITTGDVYWIEDEELIEKLNESEMNFTETKYAGVTITVRMYDVLFEHIYLQKMICDKGLETSRIKLDLPMLTEHDVTLLDLEVLLICLLCKYYNMSPDLLTSPSKELAVLGFNFDADLEAIKKDVLDNPRIYSEELANYIINITFTSVSDVNHMYANAHTLSKMLIEGMETTNSPQVYHAYKKLYNALLITDVHNEVFALSDGTIPETYMDWLKENNYKLYEYIVDIDETEILDKINYITTKMISWFTECKHLDHLNPMGDDVLTGIIKILRWFKSYTMDIRSLDVIYLFDSKYHNMMKFMNRLWIHSEAIIRELDIGYNDWVNQFIATMGKSEIYNKFEDFMNMYGELTFKDLDKLIHDRVIKFSESVTFIDNPGFKYMDGLVNSVCEITKKEYGMRFRESVRILTPDEYYESKIVHHAEYDAENERLILHEIPTPSTIVDEHIDVKKARRLVTDDEELFLG